MLITTLLKNPVSVREFQNRPVPEEVIQEMLEAARLSPSDGNEQPWVFGVITDCGLIEAISHLAYGQEWIAHAPLLIILCTVCVEDGRGGRDIQMHRYPHPLLVAEPRRAPDQDSRHPYGAGCS